jgi:hypothetical protein
MYEPLSRCAIVVETPTSVAKNVSIGVATSGFRNIPKL